MSESTHTRGAGLNLRRAPEGCTPLQPLLAATSSTVFLMLAFALTRVFALRCRTRLHQRRACDKRQHGALRGSVRWQRWASPVRDTLLSASPPPRRLWPLPQWLMSQLTQGRALAQEDTNKDGRLDEFDVEFFEDCHEMKDFVRNLEDSIV